jgi:hypothetical protein
MHIKEQVVNVWAGFKWLSFGFIGGGLVNMGPRKSRGKC